MTMLIVPELPEKAFQKIVEILPAPSSVEVQLFGDFDYTAIYEQVQQLLPEAKMEWQGGHTYSLENPSKDLILKIHRRATKSPNKPEEKMKRSMTIHKIEWWLDDAKIRLTPWELEITYSGKEPLYLMELRRVIESNDMVMKIKASMRTH